METKPTLNEDNSISVYCNKCQVRSLHIVKNKSDVMEILDYNEESGLEKTFRVKTDISYAIIECCGCLSLSFRKEIRYPKYNNIGLPITGTVGEVITRYYPERLPNIHIYKNYKELPTPIQIIYKEVIDSFNKSLPILCAAGLRTLIEVICNEQKVAGGNLKEKISNLSKLNLLGYKTAKALDLHRLLGNYALHLIDRPEKDELKAAIELAEHALSEIYSVPGLKKNLERVVNK